LNNNNIPTVDFTEDYNIAKRWVDNGLVVYCRKLIDSSSGNGIVVVKDYGQLEIAPLYTKGVVDGEEFRVHIINNKVIDVTKKLRPRDREVNELIRNHGNGWVFGRDGIKIPRSVIIHSKRAIKTLGLDFGAVDIIYKDGSCYILEVNTAPGLVGTTLSKYVEAFKKVINKGV
jgi:glutathione synthase/RimK-type ligase-like ATP-grasp enzyme